MDMNETLSIEEKVDLLFNQYEQTHQEQEKNKIEQEKYEDELSSKYDLVLEVLKDEYFASIESIRYVEEKINKFFVILTIAFTGLFTILASSLFKLKFYADIPVQNGKVIAMIIISYFFVFFLTAGFIYLFRILNQLIDGLALIETHRLPDLYGAFDDPNIDKSNFISFQKAMIQSYQKIINFNNEQKNKKQTGLQNATQFIKKSLVFNGLAMLLLLINSILN